MNDCTKCKYATWDCFEYYGGGEQRFVDGWELENSPDECEEGGEDDGE